MAFGRLDPRTSLRVGDLNIERPTDPGGASWFAISALLDISPEGRRHFNRDDQSPGGTVTLRVRCSWGPSLPPTRDDDVPQCYIYT